MGAFIAHALPYYSKPLGYQVWVPEGIEGPLPTILFLHGSGESGTDNEAQITVGLPRAIRENPERWPYLVVCPQKSDEGVLWPAYQRQVDEVLADVESRYSVDRSRCYLTGLSQGGHATLAMVRSLRWTFAAVAAVCGWADPKKAANELKTVPTWLFHCADDEAVPASCSQAVADCLRQGRGSCRLTMYPSGGHDSWTRAYGEEGLQNWFQDPRFP